MTKQLSTFHLRGNDYIICEEVKGRVRFLNFSGTYFRRIHVGYRVKKNNCPF